MTDPRLPVVLLWHMHQPPYRDALSGRYVLPWTYLHAIKDYTDMAAHLEQVPGAKAVVNFTPVLIEQIEDLDAAVRNCLRTGAPLPDALLATLGPGGLSPDPAQRLVMLRACLRADRETLIRRHPPFEELFLLAQTFATPERIAYASDQFLYDLSVWYHIAWMGESVRREDPRVAALTLKGRGFDLPDRLSLLALIGEMAEHPGQCLGPVVMGAPGNRESQHGFQNVDLLVPILGQLGYGVDQRVLDSFNLLLRLHGCSLQSASHNGLIRESLQTIKVAGSASSSLGRAPVN